VAAARQGFGFGESLEGTPGRLGGIEKAKREAKSV